MADKFSASICTLIFVGFRPICSFFYLVKHHSVFDLSARKRERVPLCYTVSLLVYVQCTPGSMLITESRENQFCYSQIRSNILITGMKFVQVVDQLLDCLRIQINNRYKNFTPGFKDKSERVVNIRAHRKCVIWLNLTHMITHDKKLISHLYYILQVLYKIAKHIHHITTTILHNHSWLKNNGLDLFELIVASLMVLILQYMFLIWCEFSKSELT
jgi:hypothetical protein